MPVKSETFTARSRTYLILPEADRQYGGPLSFSKRLMAYLDGNGWQRHPSIDADLAVLIVLVRAPIGILLKARRLGIPIVLRLDGLYYPGKSGYLNREYLRVNLMVSLIRRFLCDYIVYQSEFSRRMCADLIGPSDKPYRIVYNAAPVPPGSAALPKPGTTGNRRLRLVTTGNFRGLDMLPATIKALDLCARGDRFTLDIYGKLDAGSKPWVERPYARYMGPRSSEEVLASLGGYDALLFTQLCPSCPNVVVEAMAVGIPVIAYDSGSVRELINFNLELIAPVSDRLLHSHGDLRPEALAECVETFLDHPDRFKSVAEEKRRQDGGERCFAAYVEVMDCLAPRKE